MGTNNGTLTRAALPAFVVTFDYAHQMIYLKPRPAPVPGLSSRTRCAVRKPHAKAPGTPTAGLPCEDPGDLRPAILTSASICQLPLTELIPVALDDAGSALRTVGAAAGAIVNVTCVDITQAVC
jgi:hypothetical protein